MRTVKEVVDRINDPKVRERNSILHFEIATLVDFVPFVDAMEFGVLDREKNEKIGLERAKREWNGGLEELDHDSILESARLYMGFAWGKAADERGISAHRSIQRFQAWTWLLGDFDRIDWSNVDGYGEEILDEICTLYNWPPGSDAGHWNEVCRAYWKSRGE